MSRCNRNPGLMLAVLLLLAAKAGLSSDTSAQNPLAFKTDAQPILEQHCASCHGAKKQKAGVNFSIFQDQASILSQRNVWLAARDALATNDMPPDPADTGFKPEDRTKLLAWIKNKIETLDTSNPIYRDPGTPVVRQLTRDEYNATLRELFAFEFDAANAAGLESEDVVSGYKNLAGGLTLNEATLEKYFAGAEAILAALFDGENAKKPKAKTAREALLKPAGGATDLEAARKIVDPFMRRAFRRPVEKEETDRVLGIFSSAQKSGDTFEMALRKALKPVLVSPYFLYRMETEKAGAKDPYAINDFELATRLSYFIWATMPDEELFKHAAAGELSKPDVLAAQLKRILADPKAKSLADSFGMQWLQLGGLDRALPSKNNFPAFTNNLKQAMKQESLTFFDKLRTEDRSILELLDSDYTYLNEELAKFYGIPGVSGKEFQRVALKPEFHRGGVLCMSSMLASTSHVDRTKPTTRGKWILEVLLGTPPAPPPADAGTFKPTKDKQAPKNFREKLAMHATETACAGCHKKIDPLGFALENFDAIGTWREQVGGVPVDNSGELPGQEKFKGIDGLKKIMATKQDQFVRNLVVQMMTYALGRNIEYFDELAVSKVCEALKKDGYKFSTLVREIATSRPFLYRKNLVQP